MCTVRHERTIAKRAENKRGALQLQTGVFHYVRIVAERGHWHNRTRSPGRFARSRVECRGRGLARRGRIRWLSSRQQSNKTNPSLRFVILFYVYHHIIRVVWRSVRRIGFSWKTWEPSRNWARSLVIWRPESASWNKTIDVIRKTIVRVSFLVSTRVPTNFTAGTLVWL